MEGVVEDKPSLFSYNGRIGVELDFDWLLFE
jgi:hypothetical protein